MSKSDYQITFDGGSIGNPGHAYGSYRIRPWVDETGKTVRLSFGRATNNEAEYLALLAALHALHAFLEGKAQEAGEVSIEIRGDSQLVLRQASGEWKAKDERMRRFRDEVMALAKPFAEVAFVQQPRRQTVEVLGH